MTYASTSNMHWETPKRIAVTTVAVIGLAGFSLGLTRLESSTMYRVLTVVMGAVVLSHMWKARPRIEFGIATVALIVTFVVCGELPQGYSWAQSYSLLLLLWVGFLGASMAARQRRHLSIDLARKLLHPKKLPLFNTLSYAAAGLFSGIVFYLSFIYMFDAGSTYIRPIWDLPTWLPQGFQEQLQVWPVPDNASVFERIARVLLAPGEPGEPPDWLKVLAIPVSFFLITLRFGVHALTFAAMAVRKEEFVEALEVH
jgi:TRAP-type C4-dicarboxylate transport system permease small subunit